MSIVNAAPCLFCGYNGSGYWKAGTHEKDCPFHKVGGIEERRAALPKVFKSLRTQLAEAKAEIERLKLVEHPLAELGRSQNEIVVGTYQCTVEGTGAKATESGFGGTNCWDKLIYEAGLNGVKLEVILRPATQDYANEN